MSIRYKLWTNLSVAVVAGTTLANDSHADQPTAAYSGLQMLAQAQADNSEGGEGGEGGGGLTEYSLSSTNSKDFVYEAGAQIEGYRGLVESSYKRATSDAAAMQSVIDDFLAQPTAETLAAARGAWVAARPAYLATEAYRFYGGPIDAVEGRINAWPLNEAAIDYVVGKPDAGLINDLTKPVTIDTINANDQVADEADVTTGWHAIEFLLWGQDLSADGPGARAASDYLPGQGNNDRRRQYLKLVTAQLVGDLNALAAAWAANSKGNYAEKFLALPPREAIGRLLNGAAILTGFEFMSARLAVALDSGDQEDEHSCFSDTTHQDFVNDLSGVKAVWTGTLGDKSWPGLYELVLTQDDTLAQRIDDLLADAEAKIAKLGDPWDRVLAQPAGAPARLDAEAAVVSLQALAKGLTDVGTKLGVLVLVPSSTAP